VVLYQLSYARRLLFSENQLILASLKAILLSSVLLDRKCRKSILGLFLKFPNPMISAHVAQSVERVLGKDEVGGSNPLVGSIQYHN
jgi:hypothetical protein